MPPWLIGGDVFDIGGYTGDRVNESPHDAVHGGDGHRQSFDGYVPRLDEAGNESRSKTSNGPF